MLQLIGFFSLLIALYFGYEPIGKWFEGEISADDAFVELRQRVGGAIGDTSSEESVNARLNQGSTEGRMALSEPGSSSAASDIGPPPPQSSINPDAGETAALAKRLLEQSRLDN
jgi:hypothetical protein